MTEKIKKFAEQSGLDKVLEEHAREYGAGSIDNTLYPELEKFAELVVQDCARIHADALRKFLVAAIAQEQEQAQ